MRKIALALLLLAGCKRDTAPLVETFLGGATCEYAGENQVLCTRNGERMFCSRDRDKIGCWMLGAPVEGKAEDGTAR